MNVIEPDAGRWNHGGPPDPERLKHVIAECWPLAADEQGIWALQGVWPLQTWPIGVGVRSRDMLELELIRVGMLGDLALLHQTSSQETEDAEIKNYMAVIHCNGPVRLRWRDAIPLEPKVAGVVGKPPTHSATEDPAEVRQYDVITHGLRHLAFQLGPAGDAELAAALDGNWGEHLARWTPTLYAMYDRRHSA